MRSRWEGLKGDSAWVRGPWRAAEVVRGVVTLPFLPRAAEPPGAWGEEQTAVSRGQSEDVVWGRALWQPCKRPPIGGGELSQDSCFLRQVSVSHPDLSAPLPGYRHDLLPLTGLPGLSPTPSGCGCKGLGRGDLLCQFFFLLQVEKSEARKKGFPNSH